MCAWKPWLYPPGPMAPPQVPLPPPMINEWFTELLFTPLGPFSTASISTNPYPLHNLRPYHPPPLYVSDPNAFIVVGLSPPSQGSWPRKQRRQLPIPSKSTPHSLSSPSFHFPPPKVPHKWKGKKIAPHSLSPLSSHSPSPEICHKQKGKEIAPCWLSPLASYSPSPEVPCKRKEKKSTLSSSQTGTYGIFTETPKKVSAKKAKLSYKQHSPWELQTCLSWKVFCAAIALNMHCTVASLDTDSFSWQAKPTWPGTNIRNDFGYQQMVAHICLLLPNPIPNIYLIMNSPRASGKQPVSLNTNVLFTCMCLPPCRIGTEMVI